MRYGNANATNRMEKHINEPLCTCLDVDANTNANVHANVVTGSLHGPIRANASANVMEVTKNTAIAPWADQGERECECHGVNQEHGYLFTSVEEERHPASRVCSHIWNHMPHIDRESWL